MTLPPAEKLPLRIKIGHGIGSVVYGVKDNGFSVLLMLFYNQALGLDAGTIGLILLIALLMDAMIDPLVGYWGDKTHSRWGKRHPWLYASIIPMALCWVMLWHPIATTAAMQYLHLFIFAFLMRASVSCFEVPSLSIVPALSADYDERTSITRWRFLCAWSGGLTMVVLAFSVFLMPEPGYPVGQLNVNGYARYGVTGAILIIAAALVSALTTHNRLARLPELPPTHVALRAAIREAAETLTNRPAVTLLTSSLFTFINFGMSFSITVYLLNFYWELPQSGFLAYAASLFIGVVAAFLLVGIMQSRTEKRTGAAIAGIAGVTISVLPYFLRLFGVFPENGSPALIPALFTLITVGNAFAVCATILGQSMGSDVIEAIQAQTGRRSEGVFFAGYFFVQKCATGLGLFITGTIISLSGFPNQAKPGDVAPAVLDHLVTYYLLVLAVCATASITAISRFPITRADHQRRLRQLGVTSAESGN